VLWNDANGSSFFFSSVPQVAILGATPLAEGPRQLGQLSARTSVEVKPRMFANTQVRCMG